MDTSNMITNYELIEPNYYHIYFSVLYHCLPNATDIFNYFKPIFHMDHDEITEQCERIQYSIFQ
jgi:hypothetical protein